MKYILPVVAVVLALALIMGGLSYKAALPSIVGTAPGQQAPGLATWDNVGPLGVDIDISDETNLTAGDYLTLTDDDIDHDVIDRVVEIMGASLTANATNPFTAATDVTFQSFMTLNVPEFDNAGGDYGAFAFELPGDFAFGGTSTVTYHFWAIGDDITSGTVVGSLRLSTTIANIENATAQTATATWATDEVAFKSGESNAITIYDSGTAAAGDMLFGDFQVTSGSTADQDPYILLIVMTFKGV